MANWEDALIDWSAGEEEETPIFTALFLEYREAAFRRIGATLETPGEEGKEDS